MRVVNCKYILRPSLDCGHPENKGLFGRNRPCNQTNRYCGVYCGECALQEKLPISQPSKSPSAPTIKQSQSGMKDHEIREFVNELTKIARKYGQTEQLRGRISECVIDNLK